MFSRVMNNDEQNFDPIYLIGYYNLSVGISPFSVYIGGKEDCRMKSKSIELRK